MDQSKIGAFLKSLRKEKGLTQEQLAEQMSVSSRTVSRWETGSNMPDISILIELADFYDVDIREIISGERKSEIMTEETREVLTKVAEYTDADKQKLMKDIIVNSVIALICLIAANVMHETGLTEKNEIFNFLYVIGMYAPIIFVGSTIWDIVKINGSMGKNSEQKIRKIVTAFGVSLGVICLAIILFCMFL